MSKRTILKQKKRTERWRDEVDAVFKCVRAGLYSPQDGYRIIRKTTPRPR